MDNRIKVSVIVPVYNVENYIRDMLLSVQNQIFKDFSSAIRNAGVIFRLRQPSRQIKSCSSEGFR